MVHETSSYGADSSFLDTHSIEPPVDERLTIVQEMGIGPLLATGIPVDVERLAKSVGASEVMTADIPASGMLVPADDEFTILLNKTDITVRQRFSCAHEIAHAIFEPKYTPAARDMHSTSKTDIEKRCDWLAAFLLMPSPTFNAFVNQLGPSLRTVVKLADIFYTSLQSAALRFIEVATVPCILIKSSLRVGTTGRRLRIDWSSQSTAESKYKPKNFIPKNKSISFETAKLALQSRFMQSDVENIQIGNLSTTAFTQSQGFGSGEKRFVLTLIFP